MNPGNRPLPPTFRQRLSELISFDGIQTEDRNKLREATIASLLSVLDKTACNLLARPRLVIAPCDETSIAALWIDYGSDYPTLADDEYCSELLHIVERWRRLTGCGTAIVLGTDYVNNGRERQRIALTASWAIESSTQKEGIYLQRQGLTND